MSLEFLSMKAAGPLLVRLLDGPQYMSQLYTKYGYDRGIASQSAIEAARNTLKRLGLVEDYIGEETPRPRLYLRLTEKGRQVAEHLKVIQDLLSTSP